MYKFFHQFYHKRYHGIYRHAKKLFIFDLALLGLSICILASGLFFFFWKPGLVDLVDLSISLGAERIKSGDYMHLTIDYTNRSKYKLQSANLSIRLPNGFLIDRNKTPESILSKNSTFTSLKELEPGAKGQTEIYGWLWAEPNKEEKIIADLSYTPEKTNRREQKLAYFISKLPASVLEGKLIIATSSFPNQILKFTYTLANHGTKTANNISITHNWPTSIIEEKDSQNISLPPNSAKVISGQLTLPNRSGKYSLEITPQVLINNHLITQTASEQEIEAFAPNVVSSARFTTNAAYAEPQQILPVEIQWNNQGKFKLQNLRLRLTANLPNIVDWNKTAQINHLKSDNRSLIIDKSARTAFSNGGIDSGDTFIVSLQLLPLFNLNQTTNAYLEIIPTIEGNINEVIQQNFTQEGARTRIPLATEVILNAEARYYTEEGDQLGRGPLPPKVVKTTKYWIFIKIFNTSNPLRDATFSAMLPTGGVEHTGKQSVTIGPQIQYDSKTRKLSWSYDSLPANSQTGLYFEVAVTPNASQLGQNILLVKDIQFSTTDDFVKKDFNLRIPLITNVLNKNDRGYLVGSQVIE